MLLLIYNGMEFKTKGKLEAFQRNVVLESMNWLVSLLSLFAAFVIHLMNFLGSNKVLKVINEMWSLQQEHFRSYNVLQDCPQFTYIVVQKGFTILAQTGNLLIVHFGMVMDDSTPYLVLFVCLTQIAINLTVMQCFTATLLVYGYLWKLNDQLREIFNAFNGNRRTNSSRIRKLLSQRSRLLELSKRIGSVFELQMALILTGAMAGNIVVIFFLIVYGISLHNISIFLVIFPQTLIVNMWDFWLNIVVCEVTERAGRETSLILKKFTDIKHTEQDIERIVVSQFHKYVV